MPASSPAANTAFSQDIADHLSAQQALHALLEPTAPALAPELPTQAQVEVYAVELAQFVLEAVEKGTLRSVNRKFMAEAVVAYYSQDIRL